MIEILTNRQQYVAVNGSESSIRSINYGIPRGTVLGPLLFIIYINDILEIAKYAKLILYADDVNIIITANTIEEVSNQLRRLKIA